MSGKQSRDKGKRGERMLSAELRRYGYSCRRGQQYSGGDGAADVIGLPGIHIECKFVENLNIPEAIRQAVRDARQGEIPVVIRKKSRKPWFVTMRGSDFLKIIGCTENPDIATLAHLTLRDWIEIYRTWEAGETIGRMDKATPSSIG